MTTPFMRAYSLLLIKTCHRRGAFAMGGMAAQIPIKNDPAANEQALAKVRADKEREATDGHDGTWVAHPGLVAIAKEAFDKVDDRRPTRSSDSAMTSTSRATDLLDFQPKGPITEQGLRININIGIQYLGAWLAGTGCVPIFNLMEDAATAEISRAQIWQWIRSPHGVLDDGRKVTKELFRELRAAGTRKSARDARRQAVCRRQVRGGREDVRGADARRGFRRVPHPARVRLRHRTRAPVDCRAW